MWGEVSVAMEAVDRSRNVFRAWRVDVGTDLFGLSTVNVTFGRTGTPGRTVCHPCHDATAARRLVRQLVARRAGAKRRIGIGYRTVEIVGLEDWLSADGLLQSAQG